MSRGQFLATAIDDTAAAFFHFLTVFAVALVLLVFFDDLLLVGIRVAARLSLALVWSAACLSLLQNLLEILCQSLDLCENVLAVRHGCV